MTLPAANEGGVSRSCRVQDLVVCCAHLTLHGPDQIITGLTADSRQVLPGFIFAALSGTNTTGAQFVPAALQAGASVILHDGTLPLSTEVTQLCHAQPRRALALLAAAFYGHPARELTMVAITGTNGKTTTAAMIEAILSQEGDGHSQAHRVGVIGTTGIRYPGQPTVQPAGSTLTTPDPVALHHYLRLMVGQRCSVVVMEVSSHALDQQRTAGIPWRVVVFTNLTRDHLDYHGSEEAYFASKARLFLPEGLVPSGNGSVRSAVAVIGTDDPWGRKLVAQCAGGLPVATFGVDCPVENAQFQARDIRLSWRESCFQLIMPKETVAVCLPSAGRFNVANALAAAATCRQLGLRGAAIAHGLRQFRPARGRMESIQAGQPFAVVVDYAHTPDALERLLESARMLTQQGRMITVFGCGGERDTGKRFLMGQLAARLSEYTIITDDNPRSEDPAAIRQAILSGCRLESGHTLEIPDRAAAIARALDLAVASDAVLIVGKGHETVQITANGILPFDDVQTARIHLAQMGFVA